VADTIEEFVQERGIKSLFHFTRLENLRTIIEHGFLTRERCAETGIQPAVNDHDRYDGTGAVCATIGFPNYKLFYSLRCDNPAVEWVVLELDSSLLWRTRCAFSSTNAGDGSVFRTPIAERQGLPALRAMFGDYAAVQRQSLKIPDHYTTNPQAEVLLLDGAAADDGNCVYFERWQTQKQFLAEYPGLQCKVNGGYFNGRHDYAHWK
jgi:hypothetical protein